MDLAEHSADGNGPNAGTTLVWKARPVFVSSTFRDMHAERDYLRTHAFPELAEQLRERCHYLDAIDLRQGVENADEADEAARELRVLKVCLGEVERSKPFIVALLGDRYGWVPPAERIRAAAHSAGLPTSVEVGGRSVTELEILHGVLENPDQRRRSWFYFRALDRTSMPPAVAARFPAEEPSEDPASPAGKLRALKERIRRELPDRVRDYVLRWDAATQTLVGLTELDAMVAHDLWGDLDAETADYLRLAPRTWQKADARALADFVAERTRSYVERPAITGPMLEHALSPPAPDAAWGLVITGESGGGKSTLFGTVHSALHAEAAAGRIVLLSHAAGVFPQSGQVDRMLRRWVTELAAHLGVPDPLAEGAAQSAGWRAAMGAMHAASRPSGERDASETRLVTSDQIESTFASLLGRAAVRGRVVLLIDALNQFEPTARARYLTWLPKLWPANARLVATAITGEAIQTLLGRPGCRTLPVPAVSRDEARAIAQRFNRERHHRDLNSRVLDALLAKALPDHRPAYGNPLWLALALQEINLLEADEFERAEREFAHLSGAARMAAMQMAEAAELPADVPGVYGELLDRAERGYGLAWTQAFVDLIALSRSGWRESDLRDLMPQVSGQDWDDLAFAGVRRALGTHVAQRGACAQWNFFHAALRETVLRRDLADEAAHRRLHGLLADHLESLPADDPLRVSETMVHLLGLGDRDRAAVYINGVSRLQWGDPSPLAGAVAVLVEAINSAPDDAARGRITDWIADLMGGEDEQRNGRVALAVIYDLNDALAAIGTEGTERPRGRLLHAARDTLQRLATADPSNVRWQRELGVSCDKVGDVLKTRGDLAGALHSYQEASAVAGRLVTVAPTSAVWWRDLAVTRNKIGAALVSQGDLPGALRAFRESLAIGECLVAIDPSNMLWQSDLSASRSCIGRVLGFRGDLAGALKSYRESMAIRERLAASDPSNAGRQGNLSESRSEIGDVLRAQGDLAGALKSYRESMAIRESLAASDPSNAGRQGNLSVGRSQIGDVLRAQGDLAGALESYRESMAIDERLVERDPCNAVWQYALASSRAHVGDVLCVQSDLPGALQAYRESMAAYESLVTDDPSDVAWQSGLSSIHGRIGDVLRAQGDLSGALKAYQDFHADIERLAAADPSDARRQFDLSVSHERIGDVLHAQGDLSGALCSYGEAFRIDEGLGAVDPSNADWQSGLSVTHCKIGDVLWARGDRGAALRAYRESLRIDERLAAGDPYNALRHRDLAVSHERIGNVLRAQGDPVGALESYRKSMAIRKRLAVGDPTNAAWERDLSVSHCKVGEVLWAQGDDVGALDAYREHMATAERLAARDPANASWQGDLSLSYCKVGDVLQAQRDLCGALEAYRKALACLERLAAIDPSNAAWQEVLSLSHRSVGDVLRAQDDLPGALRAYRESLAIDERLAAIDPSSAVWQRGMLLSHSSVGEVLWAKGDQAGALRAFQESLAIGERLVARDPSSAVWQRDLAAICWRIADITEETGQGDARAWWRRAHDTLAELKQRGVMRATDEKYLEELRQHAEG